MTYLRSPVGEGSSWDLNPGFPWDTLPATVSTGPSTLALPYRASQCCLPGPSLQPDLGGTQPSEQSLPQLYKSSSALDLHCSWSLPPPPPPTLRHHSPPSTQCYLQPLSRPVLRDSSSLIPKTGDEWSHQPVGRPLPLDKPGDIWVTLKESSYQ